LIAKSEVDVKFEEHKDSSVEYDIDLEELLNQILTHDNLRWCYFNLTNDMSF